MIEMEGCGRDFAVAHMTDAPIPLIQSHAVDRLMGNAMLAGSALRGLIRTSLTAFGRVTIFDGLFTRLLRVFYLPSSCPGTDDLRMLCVPGSCSGTIGLRVLGVCGTLLGTDFLSISGSPRALLSTDFLSISGAIGFLVGAKSHTMGRTIRSHVGSHVRFVAWLAHPFRILRLLRR